MKNLKTKLIIIFFLCSIISNAQVGIGTSAPEATLDITAANLTPATVDGLLIPRISRLRAKTMTGITTSTLVYVNDISNGDLLGTTANVNSVGFYYWNGSVWTRLSTSSDSDAWKIIGNSGTNATTNFLGTTDDVDLIFKRNNLQSGKLGTTTTSFGVSALNTTSTGLNNSAFGTSALAANSTGENNTALGSSALAANTIGLNNTAVGQRALVTNINGSSNVAVGTNALAVNTSNDNTAVGFSALNANTIGTKNTAIGTQASSGNTSGSSNTSVGYQAHQINSTGIQNVAIGERALGRNLGSSNTIVGFEAMFGTGGVATNRATAVGHRALFSNSANDNTAVGFNALQGVIAALGNTAIGSNALRINTGANNTAVGTLAGDEHGSGANNTYVGFEAGRYNTGATNNNAFFGYQAGHFSTGSFNTAIGSNTLKANAASSNNVAVGYNALTVNGSTNNTAIGFGALSTNNGTGNVAIGYNAGAAETGNNRLYIENSNANVSNALIYGEFDTNILRVNGTLQVNNPAGAIGYAFPIVRGTSGQVLQTNGAGATSWVSVSGLETDPQVSSATTNFLPRWNGTTLVDGVIRDDATNVGIGIAPSAGNKLDVAGKTRTTNFQMTNGAAANYILQSDATGNASWVQNPVNTYSYTKVNLSANQSLTTSNWQKINFDSEVIDTNSEFAGGTFTASKAGLYQVNASFHTNDQSNQEFYSIGVYVNGVLYQQMTGNHSNLGPVFRNISCAVNLAIGGTIEIFAENYQTSVNVDAFPAKTFFEIIQIR